MPVPRLPRVHFAVMRVKYGKIEGGRRMRRSGWIVLAALAVWPSGADAQQIAKAQAHLTPQQALGRQLFTQSCMVCHTRPAITAGLYGPPLSRDSAGGNADVMRDVITNGTPRMPGFKYQFSPAQIAAIAQYLKTLPPPVATSRGSGKGDVD
jgi:mono/diheme cytochrome c family protein